MVEIIALRARYWFEKAARRFLAIEAHRAPESVKANRTLWREKTYVLQGSKDRRQVRAYCFEGTTPELGLNGMLNCSTFGEADDQVILFVDVADQGKLAGCFRPADETGQIPEELEEVCVAALKTLVQAELAERQRKAEQEVKEALERERIFGRSGGPRAGALSDKEVARRREALARAKETGS
jgi:hypothetical protein